MSQESPAPKPQPNNPPKESKTSTAKVESKSQPTPAEPSVAEPATEAPAEEAQQPPAEEAPPPPPPPTVEELLASLVAHLAENVALYDDLFQLLDGDPERVPPDVRPGKYDLVLLYDIKLVTDAGVVSKLKGRSDFPEALHPHSMPTTMRNFQRTFTTMVGEPLSVKLNRILVDSGLQLTESQVPLLAPPTPAQGEFSRDDARLTDPAD